MFDLDLAPQKNASTLTPFRPCLKLAVVYVNGSLSGDKTRLYERDIPSVNAFKAPKVKGQAFSPC